MLLGGGCAGGGMLERFWRCCAPVASTLCRLRCHPPLCRVAQPLQVGLLDTGRRALQRHWHLHRCVVVGSVFLKMGPGARWGGVAWGRGTGWLLALGWRKGSVVLCSRAHHNLHDYCLSATTEPPLAHPKPPGMWTVKYFKSKQYNWSGISKHRSLLAKAKRGLLQFTPYSFDNFEWGVFSSPKRCVQVRWGGGRSGWGLADWLGWLAGWPACWLAGIQPNPTRCVVRIDLP